MTEQNLLQEDFSLLRLVPAVLRARDFRLYTGKTRLVDLWQNNGAAILGHTPPSLLRELKNTASRGLFAPFPHFLEDRYYKALARIFPNRIFRLYTALPPQLVTEGVRNNSAALWRPFVNPADPLSVAANAPPVLVPILPGVHYGLYTLAIDPESAALKHREAADLLPPGDLISPLLLSVAARGVYDLIAAAAERARSHYPRISKALKSSQWQQQGLYLTLKQAPGSAEWAALFCHFLKHGFLIPPVPTQPLILPGVLSPGEESQLAKLLL